MNKRSPTFILGSKAKLSQVSNICIDFFAWSVLFIKKLEIDKTKSTSVLKVNATYNISGLIACPSGLC